MWPGVVPAGLFPGGCTQLGDICPLIGLLYGCEHIIPAASRSPVPWYQVAGIYVVAGITQALLTFSLFFRAAHRISQVSGCGPGAVT